MSDQSSKVYMEQGGDALAVLGADGGVLKGQSAAGGTPAQASAISDFTDSSGGTADGTIEAVSDTSATDQSGPINNNFAELAEDVDAIKAALRNVGILAT